MKNDDLFVRFNESTEGVNLKKNDKIQTDIEINRVNLFNPNKIYREELIISKKHIQYL